MLRYWDCFSTSALAGAAPRLGNAPVGVAPRLGNASPNVGGGKAGARWKFYNARKWQWKFAWGNWRLALWLGGFVFRQNLAKSERWVGAGASRRNWWASGWSASGKCSTGPCRPVARMMRQHLHGGGELFTSRRLMEPPHFATRALKAPSYHFERAKNKKTTTKWNKSHPWHHSIRPWITASESRCVPVWNSKNETVNWINN